MKRSFYIIPALLVISIIVCNSETYKNYINSTGQEIPIINSKDSFLTDTTNIIEVSKPEPIVEKRHKYGISTAYKKYLVGKTSFSKDTGFIRVNSKYCSKLTYLRKETYNAFLEMYNAAKKDNVNLLIISGARSFYHQKAIWERKWNKYSSLPATERAQRILRYSSMPMSSRHHWGTDMDLNSLKNAYFTQGQGLKTYNWLKENASKYGFYQVYDDKNASHRTGYEPEKWHWSYLPLASEVLTQYNQMIHVSDFNGFLGSETAKEVGIIKKYVNGISINTDKPNKSSDLAIK